MPHTDRSTIIWLFVMATGLVFATGCSEHTERDGPAQHEASSRPADTHASEPTAPPPLTGGHRLYIDHCAPCHGNTGLGDGAIARYLSTPPRALVREPWRTFSAESDQQERAGMARVIRDGLLDRGMPEFGTTLTEEQVQELIEHILTIRSETDAP